MKYAGLEVSNVKKLRQLEGENRRLKQLVAEQALDFQALKAVTVPYHTSDHRLRASAFLSRAQL